MLYIEYTDKLSPLRFDMIEEIYDQCGGQKLSTQARENLRTAFAVHRAQVFGVHRLDANETGLVERDLRHKSAEVMRIARPGLKADLFVPMVDTVPVGATTHSYEVWDSTGMAELIANGGDDVALVGVKAGEVVYRLYEYGLGYLITVQEMEVAAFAGVPLPTEKAQEVTRGFDTRKELLAAKGNSENNFTGIFNHPNLPVVSATLPDSGTLTGWFEGEKTPAGMLADLNLMVDTIDDNTKSVEEPDAIVLPRRHFRYAQKTPVETGAGGDRRTILDEFQNHNPGVQVGWWHACDRASGSNEPGALCYRRHPEVVRMEAQQPKQHPPLRQNFAQKFLSRARYGAVEWRRPLAGVLMEGI